MATEPSGTPSLAVDHFCDMLADCSAFQTWTETANATAARAKIYTDGLPDPANGHHYTKAELVAYRPFAIANLAQERSFSRQRIAANTFDESGILEVKLQQNTPDSLGDDPTSDANQQWINSIGSIIDALCDKAADAAAGHLFFDRVDLMGWGWSRPEDIEAFGEFQAAKLRITY